LKLADSTLAWLHKLWGDPIFETIRTFPMLYGDPDPAERIAQFKAQGRYDELVKQSEQETRDAMERLANEKRST
jgi:hypothetical protein